MVPLKDFYNEYKAMQCCSSMPNKTFFKLFGNKFFQYAQQNLYKWESLVKLVEGFGIRYIGERKNYIQKNIKLAVA